MPAEAEVIGVKEVMKGLSFIDEDMYKRIKIAIQLQLRHFVRKYGTTNFEFLISSFV